VLIEGFRPGVMERLGLGPGPCLARNSRLVYGRMTGWGQTGPLAQVAGHDLNYLALSGALHGMGRPDEPPPVPLNLVADYGGGAMLLALGVLAALQERVASGMGQVVDAAMAEGSTLLASLYYGMRASGRWLPARGANHLDGGAHFYGTYACADGRFVAIAATEPQFYAELLALLGIDDPEFREQWDRARWPRLKDRMAAVFRTRTRDAWCRLAEGRDVCMAPVLDWDEAPRHPQHVAREAFVTLDGVVQPAPGPRFSRTPAEPPRAAQAAGDDLLARWNRAAAQARGLDDAGR
jgi:alpha-methylacyl-CoA racemase